MLWLYGAWIAVELLLVALGKKRIPAFACFWRVWTQRNAGMQASP